MSLFDEEIDEPWGIWDGKCQACDGYGRVNDLSLCEDCAGKLERDLIRQAGLGLFGVSVRAAFRSPRRTAPPGDREIWGSTRAHRSAGEGSEEPLFAETKEAQGQKVDRLHNGEREPHEQTIVDTLSQRR